MYSIAFEAALVEHSFVALEKFRIVTESELSSLMNYKAGDDWRILAEMLRPPNDAKRGAALRRAPCVS